jgi:hypothetical protein
MGAYALPPPIFPSVPMASLPLVFVLAFVKLMLGVVVAPLGATTPLVIET